MRYIFIALTIGLVIIGFFAHLAWLGAVITGIIAGVSKSPGRQEDLTPQTSDILGELRGAVGEGLTYRDCPFCLQKIKADAKKCPKCGEWVEPTKGYKICRHCGAKNKMQAFQCVDCSKAI